MGFLRRPNYPHESLNDFDQRLHPFPFRPVLGSRHSIDPRVTAAVAEGEPRERWRGRDRNEKSIERCCGIEKTKEVWVNAISRICQRWLNVDLTGSRVCCRMGKLVLSGSRAMREEGDRAFSD
jgi:hypothetical protein